MNKKIIERLAQELEDLDCRDYEEATLYFKEKQEIEKVEQELNYKFGLKL